MITSQALILWFFAFIFIELFAFIVWFFLRMSWNIPVTILRYTGNKGRPTMLNVRGKKVIKNGIPRLYVKGYADPVRDYLAENYYPTPRGKYGGLILWEFEDALLTPALPQRSMMDKFRGKNKLSPVEQSIYDLAQDFFKSKPVTFTFDEQLYEDLRLKCVDDVDQEFMLQEQFRIEEQYKGGWKDFLLKYGGHITIIIVAILMLVGVIMWFDKMPEFAAQCAGTAQQIVTDNLIEQAAKKVAPLG